MDWIVILGMMLVVGGGSGFLCAGVGFHAGYKKGYGDGAREQAGIWRDRLALITQRAERHNGTD